MKKKLHCKNCGTVIKEHEKSCSICKLVVEREEVATDEEEQEEKSLKFQLEFPLGKLLMIVAIIIGIILTIKGVVEFQNVEYCTADDCGLKSLFIAGVGIIMILAGSIQFARQQTKYKIQ